MSDYGRRRVNLPPESDDEDLEDMEMIGDEASRNPVGVSGGAKKRQAKFARGAIIDDDMYASDYTTDVPSDAGDGLSRSSTLTRQTTGGAVSRQDTSAFSRQGSFFSRQVSMMSRNDTLASLYSRAATLGQTLKRLATGRFEFETEEEVEEAAAHLEDCRKRRLDDGEGTLEKMTTLMMSRTETLARQLTVVPFEFVKQKTIQKIKEFKEVMESEEMQAKLKKARVRVMHASTGRPAWHPEPRKVNVPSSFNLCTIFIILLALLFPALFFFPASRDKVMSVMVESVLAEYAGPGLPPLSLPKLGQVCSSGGFSQQGLNPGSPTLDSTWWSTALGDGAQIQIQAVAGGHWLSPPAQPSPVTGRVLFTPPPAAPGSTQAKSAVSADPPTATPTAGTTSSPPPPTSYSSTYFNALDLAGPVFAATDSGGDSTVTGTFLSGKFYAGALFSVDDDACASATPALCSGLNYTDASTFQNLPLEALQASASAVVGASDLYLLVTNSSCYSGQFAAGTLYNGVFHNDTFLSYADAQSSLAGPTQRRLLQTEVADTTGKPTTGSNSSSSSSSPPPPPKDLSQFSSWGTSPLGLYSSSPPASTVFLTVVRLNASCVYLLAPNGRYITPSSEGEIVAMAEDKLPSAVFTVTPIDSTRAYFQTYDGAYLAWASADGQGRLQAVADPTTLTSQLGDAQPQDVYVSFNVREVSQVARVRGVNLGGWLLVEEWMTPGVYDNVPDLVDGWQVRLQSATNGKFWTTWDSNQVHCSSDSQGDKETWHIRRMNGTSNAGLQLRHRPTGNYLSLDAGTNRELYAKDLTNPENLVLHVSPFDDNQIMLESSNGRMLRVNSDSSLTADGEKPADFSLRSAWGGEASFNIKRVTAVQGEWQVARWAPSGTLPAFRNSFITELDWQRIAELGLNTVRIPVGFWLAEGDTPDFPFVAGAVEKLDEAFVLAEKYNIRVWLSMHGAPGGQNRGHESANRDGILDWGRPDSNSIQLTLNAIGWFAERYGKSKALFGIGVLNEPNVDLTSFLDLQTLKTFQIDAFNLIRKYSPCCFVCISGFVGGKDSDFNDHMVDPLKYNNVVYDVHYYTVFDTNTFGKLRANGIFDYVRNTWGAQISSLQQGGRTVLIGEWSLGLPSTAKAKSSDYKKFSRAQLETYNNASAGWFYWSLKVGDGSTGFPNWSVEDAFPRGWLHY